MDRERMMKGAEETAASTRGGAAGRGTRRKVSKFTEDDKENFNSGGGDGGFNEKKSPLPVGFPRLPLQDITEVLRPLNSISDEEDPSTGIHKPCPRSKGLKKMGKVHTSVLSARISKNMNRGASSHTGPSKTRKMKVIVLSVDEVKTLMLPVETGQFKEMSDDHTINFASPVKLAEQPLEGQKAEDVVSPVEETAGKVAEGTNASGSSGAAQITDKDDEAKAMDLPEATLTHTEQRPAAPEEPLENSAASTGTGSQFYQDQKRRKPLSGRSSVSSFR